MPAASPDLRTPEAAHDRAERAWAVLWASILAALVVVAAVADCARADIEVDERDVLIVQGDVETVATGGGEVIEDIGTTHPGAVVHGTVTRKVRIHGDVSTRASGAHSRACTSIGSIGGCADEKRRRVRRHDASGLR